MDCPHMWSRPFLPLRLSPYPVSHDIALTWEAGALMLLLVFSYAGFRDRRLAWFGLAWFGIWLVPTFVQGAEEINFLEPRMYAALPGMLLFLAQVQWQWFKFPQRWRPVLLAGVAGFFLLQSWTYARAFANPDHFWRTMQTSAQRSAFTYYGLGNLFMQKQAYDEAVRAYRRAIELKPDYARAYFNLGNAYYRLGQMQHAEDAYRKSLHYFPGFVKARVNLAAVFFNRANRLRDEGEHGRAIEFYQKAIELNPSFVEAYNNLGVLLSKMGKTHQGLVVLRRALALDPDQAETHLNLAIAYFARRSYDLAIAHCDRAVQLGAQVDEAFLKALAPFRQKPD
ncbi:MAG: tetratricopeptide repeat protein [candidate division KSB1 bacterium]|nr:tetratricopeptide repeat protein [candidate division KSB1 bacterium]